jgi:hypothetical protein
MQKNQWGKGVGAGNLAKLGIRTRPHGFFIVLKYIQEI